MTTTAATGWKPSIGGVEYSVSPLADDRQAWRVARQDGASAYIVRLNRDGAWSCSCPAYQYGREPCKHIGLIQMVRDRSVFTSAPRAARKRRFRAASISS
jgi:hypothetical protein